MKTTNKDSYKATTDKKEFQASNLFAEWNEDTYIVYSYGYHFPLYVWKNGTWYENSEKYSVTTSKHQTQSRPLGETFEEKTTKELKQLIK